MSIPSCLAIALAVLFSTSCSQKSTMNMMNQEIEDAKQKKNVAEKYMIVKNYDYVKDFINANFLEYIPADIVIIIESYYYGNIFLKFPQDIRRKIYFEFISVDDLRNLAISCADMDLAKSVVNASKLGIKTKDLEWPYILNGKLKNTIILDKYSSNIFSRMYMKKSYKKLSGKILTLFFKNPGFYIDLLCKVNNEEIISKYDFWIKIADWILEDYLNNMQNTKKCDDEKIKKFHSRLKKIRYLLKEEMLRSNVKENSDRVFSFTLLLSRNGLMI